MSEDIWTKGYSVHLSSFYGWSPDTWGTISYSDQGRRETVIKETTDPFIAVIYVTKSAPTSDKNERGMIVGFYLVSHEKGHRDDFTARNQHSLDPGKWSYGLRALRAFRFLDEYRLGIDEFDPTIASKGLSVARYGMTLSPEAMARLAGIPYIEEALMGVASPIDTTIRFPHIDGPRESNESDTPFPSKGRVGPGAVNGSGYFVPAEPVDAPKELYVLRLEGDTTTWLGEASAGRSIYKIGQSMSPRARLDAFQRALPAGSYRWRLERSTRMDGHALYPGFDAVVVGEDAMKDVLARDATWLGGEFYAATEEQILQAWRSGREAASSFIEPSPAPPPAAGTPPDDRSPARTPASPHTRSSARRT